MKILHTIEHYYPFKGGATEAVRQISEHLVSFGHDVSISTTKNLERNFTTDRGINIIEFDISGSSLKSYSGETKKYQDFLINSDFDIIMNFSSNVWCTDLMFPVFDRILSKKVLTPCGFYPLYRPEYRQYFESMRSVVQKYDICIVNSETYRDTQFVKENHGKYVVIPNGADEREFDFDTGVDIRDLFNIPKNNFLILLVGNHTGYKGHAEAIRIFNRANIPNSTLLIIAGNVYGRVLGPLCSINCALNSWLNRCSIRNKKMSKQIIVKNDLPRSHVISAYKSANLFLFPSRIDCSPVVLFECLASKTPFLSTDVGNSREIIEWSNAGELLPTRFGNGGFCKADIAGSVEKLEQFYHSPDELKAFAENGYRAYKEHFTWEKVAKLHERIYMKILATS
ncbi:MAG: glycosyltransferase family 4 protein [Methanomicrobiales archaeon]